MKLYVYGPMTGFGSYPLAMQGFMRAFAYHGLDPIPVDISGTGGDTARRISYGIPPENPESKLVFAMKPTTQMMKLVTDHGFKVVGKHAGDVDKIPEDWKLVISNEELTVVPSMWMASVIDKEMAGKVNLYVSNPGIPNEYLSLETVAESPHSSPFRILHCCSSPSFPERKGTPQVLESFPKVLETYPHAQLTLVVPELKRPVKKLLGQMPSYARQHTIVLVYPQGQYVNQMIDLYSKHHLLICPSRAEGAGLQPIEARSLGIPVVQTLCTGFKDYLPDTEDLAEYGIVPVSHGDLEPAWGEFGNAPGLTTSDVAASTINAISSYDLLRENARRHAPEMGKWSWEATTEGLVRRLKEIGNE